MCQMVRTALAFATVIPMVCSALAPAAQQAAAPVSKAPDRAPDYDGWAVSAAVGQRLLPGDFLWLLNESTEVKEALKSVMDRVRTGKIPTAKAAVRAAYQAAGGSHQFINGPSAIVVELLRLGPDVPEFAPQNDAVWVVRFVGPAPNYVHQEAWVSATTGQVRFIFPLKDPMAHLEDGWGASIPVTGASSLHQIEVLPRTPGVVTLGFEITPGIPRKGRINTSPFGIGSLDAEP